MYIKIGTDLPETMKDTTFTDNENYHLYLNEGKSIYYVTNIINSVKHDTYYTADNIDLEECTMLTFTYPLYQNNDLKDIMFRAIKYDHLDIVKGCVKQQPVTKQNIIDAINYARLDIIKFFAELGKSLSEYDAINCVSKGFNEEVKLLTKPSQNIMKYACDCGNRDIVSWCLEDGVVPSKYIMDTSAFNGDLNAVKNCVTRGIVPDHITLEKAMHNGNHNIVEYIINTNDKIKYNKQILSDAVIFGNFEVVKRCNMVKPTESIIFNAVKCGHMSIYEYFITECKIKPTKKHLDHAAKFNRLALMKYITSFNIKPNDETIKLTFSSEIKIWCKTKI